MRARIERDALAKMLKRVAPATKAKGGNPVLHCVLLTASDNRLTVAATDLDLRIRTSAPSQCETPGVMLVPHDALTRLIGRCPAGAVNLEASDGMLGITAGKVRAHLRGADPDVFPAEPRMDGAREVKLGEDWHAMQRVVHAAGTDTSRPTLTGVCLRDGLAVCSDSYRLARCDIAFDGDLLIPARVVTAVDKAAEGTIMLRWQGKRFTLDDGTTTWQSTCLEGEFPQTASLIPTTPPIGFAANRDDLLDAVQTVAVLGDEEFTDAKGEQYTASTVQMAFADGIVSVSVTSKSNGDAQVEVEAKTEGVMPDVRFNTRYLIPLLQALKDDEVTFSGVDHLKPWVAVERELTLLTMPLRPGAKA